MTKKEKRLLTIIATRNKNNNIGRKIARVIVAEDKKEDALIVVDTAINNFLKFINAFDPQPFKDAGVINDTTKALFQAIKDLDGLLIQKKKELVGSEEGSEEAKDEKPKK